jgi:homeobox-leucine zipper protein
VPPALLVRFLREHRTEWADPGVDAYSAAALRSSPYAVPGLRASGFMGSQVILPLAHTLEHEEVCSNLVYFCYFFHANDWLIFARSSN